MNEDGCIALAVNTETTSVNEESCLQALDNHREAGKAHNIPPPELLFVDKPFQDGPSLLESLHLDLHGDAFTFTGIGSTPAPDNANPNANPNPTLGEVVIVNNEDECDAMVTYLKENAISTTSRHLDQLVHTRVVTH